jgi:uncharacterized protein involved in outer membrane biogenesis
MRKVGIVLGILIGIVVLAIVAVWLFVDVNQYRGTIQAQAEQQLGRKVTLGEMSLGLLPPRFQVENVDISEDPSIKQDSHFVQAEKVDVRVGLLSLLRGNVNIRSLELRRPSVELVKTKQGTWNFSTLGPPAAPAAPTTPSERPSAGLALARLSILDGQLAITDLQQSGARSVYDHIDLTLLNYAPGQPFSIDLAAHIQGQGAQEVRIKGDGGPLSQDNPADTPFRGTLSLNQVGIDGLKKFLDTEMLTNAGGFLSGETQLANQPGGATAVGKLKLDQARFNGVDIGYPITLDYNLAAKTAQGLVTINNATLQLGPTPLSLAGSLNTAATPPSLDLRLKSGDVSIAELARLASAFGVAFAPGTTVTGRLNADVQAKGPADKPALTGTVGGRDLRISGGGIAQPVEVQTVDLALSPSEIRSNEFNAKSGQTTVAARFALQQYTSNSPSVDVGLRAPNATLPEIQSIAKAYGVTGLDQINGAGALNLDLRAAGPLQSLSSGAVTRALNGTMNLDFSPLKIAGFDAAHELANIGGFGSSVAGQGFTEIVRLTGRIAVKNGLAQTDDLRAQLGIGNVAATGSADLATEALNMRLSAVLTKEFSEKVGATRAGGYLNTALSNNAGELVIPAIVTGNFKQPKFTPDAQAILQMQKQRLLPTLDDPKSAVSNILGAFKPKTDKTEDQEQGKTQGQPSGQKPADAIKGVLGGFLGGKKKEQEK